MIAAAKNSADEVVRKLVEMIAARGQQPVRVLLKKITTADSMQIVGNVSLIGDEDPDAAVLMLNHAVGKHVMLTRATVDDYKQGADPEADADEPEIDFGADGEDGED